MEIVFVAGAIANVVAVFACINAGADEWRADGVLTVGYILFGGGFSAVLAIVFFFLPILSDAQLA